MRILLGALEGPTVQAAHNEGDPRSQGLRAVHWRGKSIWRVQGPRMLALVRPREGNCMVPQRERDAARWQKRLVSGIADVQELYGAR